VTTPTLKSKLDVLVNQECEDMKFAGDIFRLQATLIPHPFACISLAFNVDEGHQRDLTSAFDRERQISLLFGGQTSDPAR
jgi:hypothetical protein